MYVKPSSNTTSNSNNDAQQYQQKPNVTISNDVRRIFPVNMTNSRPPFAVPFSQQQGNPSVNELGFTPHHQLSTGSGSRHQVNDINNRWPPFEGEQLRAYSEQRQVHPRRHDLQKSLINQMTFDDVMPITVAASMNMLNCGPRAAAMGCPGEDPMLLEYPQHHVQQAGGLSGIRNCLLVNSTPCQQTGNDLMQYGEDPWDSMERFAAMGTPHDSNRGGHPFMQQRSSVTREVMVFPGTQMPPSSLSGKRTYRTQFDSSRGDLPSRMVPDTRGWLPPLVYNSNGNVPAGALVSPPRSMVSQAASRSGSRSIPYRTQINQERKKRAPSSNRSRDEVTRKKSHCLHSPMAGESRLRISFVGNGTPGEAPQYFGTKGYIIPTGLAGTHRVYQQRWRFDTKHVKIDDVICVSWSIGNLSSGTISQRTETPSEARMRQTSGNTICNCLLRHALKSRAAELEATLDSLRDNLTEFLKTEKMINALKPKSCIQGLLFFGLLHDTVQQRMRELLGITTPLHQMTPHDLIARTSGEVDGNDNASCGVTT